MATAGSLHISFPFGTNNWLTLLARHINFGMVIGDSHTICIIIHL
jgi:hypothetical protein